MDGHHRLAGRDLDPHRWPPALFRRRTANAPPDREHRRRNPRRSPRRPHQHRRSQHPATAPSGATRVGETAITSTTLIVSKFREAGVSRSWLYSEPDIRAQIDHLRDATHRSGPAPILPASAPPTPSLLRRLESARAEHRKLGEDIARLREENAGFAGRSPAPSRRTETSRQPQQQTAVLTGKAAHTPITITPRQDKTETLPGRVGGTVLDAAAQVTAMAASRAQDNLLLHRPEESRLALRLRQPGPAQRHPARLH